MQREHQVIRARCFHPSHTFLAFGEEEVEQSIPQRFARQVLDYPDRLAVKTRQCQLTYEALDHAANRVANALLDQRGAGAEPIAVLLPPGAAFLTAALGVLKAGKTLVALESTFPPARLSYMLEQSQAPALIADNATLALARQLAPIPVLTVDELPRSCGASDPALSLTPDALAVIGYTSGSTGHAKGIAWTHRAMLQAVSRQTNTTHICREDRLVMFRASLRPFLYALLNGAACFPIEPRQEEPARLADWLHQQDITVYRAAVSTFRGFAGALTGTEQFPCLRLLLLFGEPVYRAEVDLYRRHFADHCILGSSLGCNEFDDYALFFVDKESTLPAGVVPGGYPMADTEILLLDERGCPLIGDETGELAIRSRYHPVGYWRRPDLTQAAFLPDPAGGDARIYRTGDLGRRAPDGCLFHIGRKDFQVKIRGHRVEVTEVETTLLALDGVKEAVVVGREAMPGETHLVAYLIPAGSSVPSVRELRRLLGERLPDYMVPSRFVLLDRLPLTPTGKVDRRALPAPDGRRPVLDTPFVAPRTPVEEQVAGIWEGVLGLTRVGIHDNFFELGGHSLLATQMIARISIATNGAECRDIRIDPFSPEETKELVALRDQTTTDAELAALQTRSGGNLLAGRGLCDVLLAGGATVDLARAFRDRLTQAVEALRAADSCGQIVLLLDAIDHSALQAAETHTDAFSHVILNTLAISPIEGVSVVASCRTERLRGYQEPRHQQHEQ
jgi:amino acid adenylation domain-containing protein